MELGIFIVLGFLVGSFLNVCIARLPYDESIVSPRSRCPHCENQLPWWANVPVLSFVALRGRCAFCSEPISWRYPLVEILTAILFVLAWWRFGYTWQGATAAAFVSALIVITFIDIDHRIIPDVISLPGIAIGFAVSWMPGGITTPQSSAAGLLLGGGALAAIAWLYAWWTRRGGLGMGDIKLLAMIGAFLGWVAIPPTVLIASLAGSAVGIPAILIRGRHLRPRDGLRAGLAVAGIAVATLWLVQSVAGPGRSLLPDPLVIALGIAVGALAGLLVTVRLAARRYPIPFGPFLALGALLCLFLGPESFGWLTPWRS